MRGWIMAVAACALTAGCTDHTVGGNVANGDAGNHPSNPVDPAGAGIHNPTGSSSGPWMGESGLADSITGIEDRVGENAAQRGSAARFAPPPAASPAAANTDQSADEHATPMPSRERMPELKAR